MLKRYLVKFKQITTQPEIGQLKCVIPPWCLKISKKKKKMGQQEFKAHNVSGRD